MRLKIFLLFFLLTSDYFCSLAQNLSFGPVSGINFSNLRGEMIYGTFSAKTGPVNGVFARTALGSWLALKTGAEYTSLYYQERPDRGDYYLDMVPTGSFPDFTGSFTAPSTAGHWDYHFLRVPLVLEWKTPGRLSFGYGFGAFYQFLVNDEYTGKDKKLVSEEFRKENFPPATDWGWLMSASVNYSISSRLNLFLEGRSTYGKEVFVKGLDGRNGSAEMILGFGFSPKGTPEEASSESISGRRIELMPQAGITFSKSVAKEVDSDYDALPAFNSGVLVKYKLDNANSLISGAYFEQKGYRISNPSQAWWAYIPPPEELKNVDLHSDMLLDYLTIPLLLEMSFGSRFTTSLQFGMYYSLLQNARARGEETKTSSYSGGYRVQKSYFNQGFKGWFRKDDLGGLAGLRFEYRILPKLKVYTSVMRALGFTYLADKNEDDASGPAPEQLEDFRNKSWTTSFGFAIPINQN